MDHVEIKIPFIRNYRQGANARRAVERCTVRVPTIEAGSLTKAAECHYRGTLLEREGEVIAYYGTTRSSTSVKAVAARIDLRVRARMSSQKGRPQPADVVGDGRAELDAAVRAFEAGHVVVEGCLAERQAPPRIELYVASDGSVLVTDGYPPEAYHAEWRRRPASAPWMSFPLTQRDEALALADAIAGMTRGNAPDGHAVRDVRLNVKVIDPEAVERWAARDAGEGFVMTSAPALVAKAAAVAGGFTRMGSALFHDLRDKVAAGAGEEEVREAMDAFVAEVVASPAPEATGYMPWTQFKAAAKAVATRLDQVAPTAAPRP